MSSSKSKPLLKLILKGTLASDHLQFVETFLGRAILFQLKQNLKKIRKGFRKKIAEVKNNTISIWEFSITFECASHKTEFSAHFWMQVEYNLCTDPVIRVYKFQSLILIGWTEF